MTNAFFRLGDRTLTDQQTGCPFCKRLSDSDVTAANEQSAAFEDKYPISRGHTLVVPRRHVGSLFDLPEPELAGVWRLVSDVRTALRDEFAPDGFNVGVNDGDAAGQTVEHAHVHVIPRFRGDVPDPRGGIRWVKPEKAAY